MTNPEKPYAKGETAARAVIASQGLQAARAQLTAALPVGQPCQLSIDEFRYWTGFRQAVEASQ